ncbi:MAG TPA: hypothetical protein VI356_23040 [Myxococcales bacterium]
MVALVSPAFDESFHARRAAQEIADHVWNANGQLDQEDRIVLFDVTFFPSESAVFSEKATLRTEHRKWEDGMMVATTTAGDVPVLVHWVDAETLLIDPLAIQTCRVLPDELRPHLPLDVKRDFAHLELGGSVFPVLGIAKNASGRWWDVRIDNPGRE